MLRLHRVSVILASAWLLSMSPAVGTAVGAQLIPVPAGFSYYCSMVNGTAWLFASGSAPCEDLMSKSGWKPIMIQRAGLYNTAGGNTVAMRCEGGYSGVWRGYGKEVLKWAFDAGAGHEACIYTVSPEDLPIFAAPFSLNPLPDKFNFMSSGMNFASTGLTAFPLNVLDYGQRNNAANGTTVPGCVGAGCSQHVNYRGQDRTLTQEAEHHRGIDWGMKKGTPLLALASGTVAALGERYYDAARTENCEPGVPGEPQMKELWIKYEVGPGTQSYYKETFYVAYGHMDSIKSTLQVTSPVSAGQVVGTVGWSGTCGGEANAHLHMNVVRTSNTARYYRKPIIIDTPTQTNPTSTQNSCGWGTNADTFIDPYGWKATHGIDPGAHLFSETTETTCQPDGNAFEPLGMGAMSINLWKNPPPKTCDMNEKEWPLKDGTSKKNPYRKSVPHDKSTTLVNCSTPK
jgi:hypothetical protein